MEIKENVVLEIVIDRNNKVKSIEYVNSYWFNLKIAKGDFIFDWFDENLKKIFAEYIGSKDFNQQIKVTINQQQFWLQLQIYEEDYKLSLYKSMEQFSLLNKISFQLLDLSEDNILIVNNLGRIVYANKAFCYLSNYSYKSLIGKMFYPLFINSEQYNNSKKELYQDSIISLDGAIIPVNVKQQQFVLADNEYVTIFIAKSANLSKKAEIQLTLRDQILESLYFASQQFLCSDKWNENIQAVLENLGKAIYACKIKIYENYLLNDEELCMKLYAEWNNEQFKHSFSSNEKLISYFPFYEEIFLELSKGNIYFIDSEEKNNFYRKQHLSQSAILLPINVNNKWWGLLCVEVSQSLKIWNTQEIQALKQITTIIGAAIWQHQIILHQQQLKVVAEKSNLLKTVFLSNIGHEFRTPLNSIIGFAELLRKTASSEEKLINYAQHIIENSYRLLRQIDNLIEYSNLEAGTYLLKEDVVNIQEFLTSIGYITQKKILKSGKNISVKIHCTGNNCEIITDRKKIERIFEHLTDNAVKFTHTGFIEIGCKKIDDRYQFFVMDTGIGIDEKYLKIVLNEFSQIENEKTRIYSGIGMGLAIVNKIISILNGKIFIQSAVSNGTTIFLELPFKLQITEKKETSLNNEQESILIYDDNDEMFEKLYSILKQKYTKVERLRKLDNITHTKAKYLIVNATNPMVKQEIQIISQKNPNLKIVQHSFKSNTQFINFNKKISSEYYWNIFCKLDKQK